MNTRMSRLPMEGVAAAEGGAIVAEVVSAEQQIVSVKTQRVA